MNDSAQQLLRAGDLGCKVGRLFQKRCQSANERFAERFQSNVEQRLSAISARPVMPWEWGRLWFDYLSDMTERSILFWDTIRRRGNSFLERQRAGNPPVLHFDYEMVSDARKFKRPVNYALVRIVPPQGVSVDPARRPYVIIDPRAGHGPGIGGFKDDSQAGVAMRAGHPVYFVIFFPRPEPGQTLLDVCGAEQEFIRTVRQLHPNSPKPVIIGNCQGGWAAMMLASSSPEDTGPIIINGSPMSYWGGAWTEDDGNNPMRYAGGLLGGSWMSSLAADLGNGLFDGAHLVQNFDYLNPANTYWDKYYHVFANADTEPPRFLDFERWWSGYFLMNREEIEWIVQNLFVGNKLWTETRSQAGTPFDLRLIKSPIVLFASMGDNITPPQQAFNWVADIYASTDEIKARGQVIVGLLHQSIGHLGIFVSGKVAKKEHTQLVSVMKSIEALPPGLYGMRINESRGPDGKMSYEVDFVEHRLEEIAAKLNRFERKDERAFEAVAKLSEFNQRAYELFLRPFVQASASDFTADLMRTFNPLRSERWSISDLNPWLAWLGPAAGWIKSQRHPVEKDQPLRQAEAGLSDMISASLDFYRDMRDAISETAFFLIFGSLFELESHQMPQPKTAAPAQDPREMPVVKQALAAIEQGGYAEAISRVGYLLARKGKPLPLARLQVTHELQQEYADLLPQLQPDQRRRIRGEQDIICRYEPDRAIGALPKLLSEVADRERFRTLLERLLADPRFIPEDVTPEQRAMVERIRGVLAADGGQAMPLRPAATAAPTSN
jgi:pimeloyl-ACP methyl ester carboxylesterase